MEREQPFYGHKEQYCEKIKRLAISRRENL